MFWLSTYRTLKFGLQNFTRNFWLSIVTVTIITLSLLSVSALGLVTVVSAQALASLEQKIDINVYLKPKLPPAQVAELQQELAALPGVKSVSYTSPDEALARFHEKYQGNQQISEALVLLGVNPLGASLTIKAYSEEGYRTILDKLEGPAYADVVQEARFEDYRRVIAAVDDLSAKAQRAGLVVSAFFLAIALLVVFNTIRINIYTQREEIEIKRLVGATNWFIRAPFWVESILYALVGTLLTAGIFYASLVWLDPYLRALFSGYQFSATDYFAANGWLFFGSQFLAVALLSILASAIAMRRYLRV